MGYRVDYSQESKMQNQRKRHSRVIPFTVLFFLLFLLFTSRYWQQGAQTLRELLLPGDAAVTAAALQDFTLALKTGESLSSAFADFCHQVMQGAGIYLG